MTALSPIALSRGADAGGAWRLHLVVLAAVAAAMLLLFAADIADMATIWFTVSTYNHCVLVGPITAWLVSQRLPELRQLAPAVYAPGLLIVAAGALARLLGEAGGVALFRHAGFVAMLQGAVVACLGAAVARGLAFPLFFTLFLIPAGDELIPLMQVATARIATVLLDLVGIPAHIEGIFIAIPSGLFRVAEACAGVEFLVAMLAYGALVANLCFRSPLRRTLFMAVAVLVPILANGVRAWGTIWIADRTDIAFADGFDHILYGWFFFGFVIALVMAAGWPFFDRSPGDRAFDPAALPGAAAAGDPARLIAVAAAAVALAAVPPLWSAAIASTGYEAAPDDFRLPEVAEWQRVPGAAGRPWQPHFAGADLVRIGRYRNGEGQQVDLAIAVFTRQEEGRELVGYGQGAIAPEGRWSWVEAAPPPPGGKAERIASFGTGREVATFYRVGDILTGSEQRVKLETMRTRLLGGRQRAVAVLVSAEAPAEGVSPRPAIDAFLADLGPIERLADQAAGG